MDFSGIQKLTLLDYPGKVACTVFTPGCDLRCPFCHNASLALPERERDVFTEDEILSFLKKRQGLLDGLAVTGGEPLMHAGLIDFLLRVKEMGYLVKLDTNGTFPDRLRAAVAAGAVDRVAMDIKASPENYARTTGMQKLDLSPIRESAAFLLGGTVNYEFRTTCVKGIHTSDDFKAIGEWIAGAEEYYLQDFKDSGDLIAGEGLGPFTAEEMNAFADIVRPYVPSVKIRGV